MDSSGAVDSSFDDSVIDDSTFGYRSRRNVRPLIASDTESSNDDDDDFLDDDVIDESFTDEPRNVTTGHKSSDEEIGTSMKIDNSEIFQSTRLKENCSNYTDDESDGGDNSAGGSLNKSTTSPRNLMASEPENLKTLEQGDVTTNRHEDTAPQIVEDSLSVVEVTRDEEAPPVDRVLKQSSITSFMNMTSDFAGPSKMPELIEIKSQTKYVTQAEYQAQAKKINLTQTELLRTKNAMRVIKLDGLPDNGKSLIDKERVLRTNLEKEKNILEEMVVESKAPINANNKVQVAWEQVQAGLDAVGPNLLGRKGMAQFQAEKHLAVETLDELHKSLDNCPGENDLAEDPKGLKVPLMQHQKRALTWLMWREKQKPSGGLLADDMGLGKTLTMISLVMKSSEIEERSEEEKENYKDKYLGGTLVVCPASLINQWTGEIERRTKRGLLDVELYHGAKRETKAKRLARHDVVITTYALILNESERRGALFSIRWRRVILDEAHQIRNHKSRTAEAICELSARSRWCLSGTPVHNKELDMYSLLKFLRCSPFDDLKTWKRWVGDKSTGGQMRLHAVVSSLMLRRTKVELIEKGLLQSMPERTWELISVTLDKDEMKVYQKILIFSRTLFAQFLHQRAEKNQDYRDVNFSQTPSDPNAEYFKIRNKLLKLHKAKDVNQHDILVLLLRLRQICCHPSLITQMLQGDEDLGNAEDEEESEEMDILEQLKKLDLDDNDTFNPEGASSECVGLKEATKGLLNRNNPVFAPERSSSKIKVLVDLLKTKVCDEDKAIIVSQWTGLLRLVAIHVKEANINFSSLDGSIPVNKRMLIVDNFNNPRSETKVLLLSLTAGGVGLNLIGANHLFLLDLHWNPQLENQAQDRIYRMGQTKDIFVYKFLAVGTIEERIKLLQENKVAIAESMLTGSKNITSSKLSVKDLKLIFDFN